MDCCGDSEKAANSSNNGELNFNMSGKIKKRKILRKGGEFIKIKANRISIEYLEYFQI